MSAPRKAVLRRARAVSLAERLESRQLLSAAFDITALSNMRGTFPSITGAGVGIAVLDTGVDALNPDLSSNVAAFYNAVEDPVNTPDISPVNAIDNNGHGTHVSGIAASSNPNIGVAYGAKLIDIKVLADANEQQLGGDPILRGLEWVQSNYQTFNIKVVNMSLGTPGVNDNVATPADMRQAEAIEINTLEKLGITVVSASGNSYANSPVPGESFPAVVSTIGVANTWATSGQASDFGIPFGESGDQFFAVDSAAKPDTLASTSQRSTVNNQLAAPGEDIYSTWNGTLDSSNGSDLLHNTISGTSMAAPFVSGVVALMQNAAEYFGGHYLSDPSQILSILQSTADPVVDGNNPFNARYNALDGSTSDLPETGLTFKRVNVLKAIEAVQTLVTGGSVITGPTPGPDRDNTAATATPVSDLNGTANFTFTGSVGTDGLVQVGVNDVDLYNVSVTSPGVVTIALSQPNHGQAFAASLRLFDTNGNIVAAVDGTANAYPTVVTGAPLNAGTYYLGISSVGNERYTIGGTGAAGGLAQGDYSVSFSLSNPDPNGTIQGAVPIDLINPNETLTNPITHEVYTDNIVNGLLGSDPPGPGSATRTVVTSDVDMYSLTAPDSGNLSISAITNVGTLPSAYLALFDANGSLLAATKTQNAGNYQITLAVTIGQTVYVAVTVNANENFDPMDPYIGRTPNATPSDGPYDLHFRFDNGDAANGTALSAQQGTLGTPIFANIGMDNHVLIGADGSKDVDWYTYTAGSAGLFDITAQSTTPGFTPDVSLWQYTPGQSDIVKVADTASNNLFSSPSSLFSPSTITPPGAAGTAHLIDIVSAGQAFFVAVTGQGNSNFNWYAVASGTGGQTGDYTLTTTVDSATALTTLSNDSIIGSTPTPISVGQTLNGNIGSDGSLVVGPADVDMYALVAPATESLDVRTGTSQDGDADTVLRVFDASGNQLAANDNLDATTTASEVHVAVQQGAVYYIGVDGAGPGAMGYNPQTGAGSAPGSTGNYSLTVTVTQPGFSVVAPSAVAAFTGSTAIFDIFLDRPLTAATTVDYSTVDGTAVAGVDYTAQSGTLTFPAGVTFLTVSVPVLSNPSATSGTRSFSLQLSNPVGAQVSTAMAQAIIQDLPVSTSTFSSGRPFFYTDSAGGSVHLILSGPGNASAVFVNGSADPSQINVTATTSASKLTIAGSGASIGNISVDGSLFSLTGRSITINGGINISGSISKLMVGNVSGGASSGLISIGDSGASTVVVLGAVSNEDLTTAGRVATLTVSNWIDSGGGTVVLMAASIGNIVSHGDFGVSLSTNSLANVKVAGNLTAGIWTIGGSVQAITAGGSMSSWQANFAGSINQLKLASASGQITASAINKLTVAHNLSSATIDLTGSGLDLGVMTVGNLVTGTQILSAGSVGKVTVGVFSASNLFAGVIAGITTLPTSAADFQSAATISSFTAKGASAAFYFSGSNVAASNIGKVLISRVNPDNGGVHFGIAASRLAAFTNKGVLVWTDKDLVSKLTPVGDFYVSLLT